MHENILETQNISNMKLFLQIALLGLESGRVGVSYNLKLTIVGLEEQLNSREHFAIVKYSISFSSIPHIY